MRSILSKCALLGAMLAVAAEARAAKCAACGYECPDGTLNCWSCGTHVPGSKNPVKLLSAKLVVVDILAERKTGAARTVRDPSGDLQDVEKWIAANPDDYAGALKRLDTLLDTVRGTVYEARVEDRIARIRAALQAASRPMTKEQREKKVIAMIAKVASKIRKRSSNPAENVRELEQILALARSTSYEGYVRKLLKDEKAKLNR